MSRRRRLAVPLLVLALTAGATVGCSGSASAAPSRTTPGIAGSGLFDRAGQTGLTDGAGRPPFGAAPAVADTGTGDGLYIVGLAEQPVTTYPGGVAGLAATRPQPGNRLDANSAAAQAYRRHLDVQRDAVASAAGVTVDEAYTTAFNGFSAKLTARQVAALRADQRVRSVTLSQRVASGAGAGDAGSTAAGATPGATGTAAPDAAGAGDPATSAAPASGAPASAASGAGSAPADGSGGVTSTGSKPGTGGGAGVVVGVLDTGIWPESPSFARTMPAPASWHGTCQTGTDFVAQDCNGKIVGARYFADAYLSAYGELPPGEVLSPRDMVGHGTHTASTAAGLPVNDVTIDGRDFGSVAGAAPDAQIAVYKVLWGGSGLDADIIAGIDAAVADGVQVLSYSVGTTLGDYEPNTPIGLAFLDAELAGVFVSAAAGNDGTSGAISNAAPWVTTVGAAVTHADEGTVRLGDGTKLVGGALDALPRAGNLPLVFGEQAGSLDADAQYCEPGSLDPAKVRGKVVACALDNPYNAVAEAKSKGALAMLLFDPAGNFMVNSIYDFPVIYLNTRQQAGTLFTYLMRHPTDGTVRLSAGGDGSSVGGVPSVADFSSTGPDRLAPGVLKPDLVAPGEDIIAAVSPPGNFGRSYDAYSGTSMATPYVAGAAAVLRAEHPDWSPGAVSSALRTTATDTVDSSPLEQGSGLVSLNRAADPGLVIEPAPADLVAFSQNPAPDGAELNLPAISLREYDGTRPVTLTRTLTNVGAKQEKYRATVSGLDGMRVTVSPSSVTIAPGHSATVTVTLSRGTATWDRYVTGAITWRSGAHSVRVPVAARAWGISPRPYDDTGLEFDRLQNGAYGLLQPGFTGPLTGRSTGYTPMLWDSYAMPAGVQNGIFDPKAAGVQAHTLTVPADTAGLVVETQDDDPDTDLDLYLYRGDTLVYRSAGWSSSEQAYAFMPEPGTYTAYVFAARSGGPVVNYQLGHVIIGRHGRYAPATLALPATVQRGATPGFQLRPDQPLPDGENWAYTELSTGGTVIPGQLVYTTQSSWN